MEVTNGFYKRNNGSEALIQVVGTHESGDYLCLWAFNEGDPFRYHPYEFNKEFEPVTEEYINNIERQCCPGHYVVPEVFKFSVDKKTNPNPDRWDIRDGIRTCSYCGSIHPDDLIKLLEEHGLGIIEESTKSYKWYINIPNGKYCKFYLVHGENTDFGERYGELVLLNNLK